jgi:hypothetical protein
MDWELEERWRSGRSPFDGKTLHCIDPIRLPELRSSLETVVRCLAIPGGKLHALEDWHEHDGYVTSPAIVSWQELLATLATDDSLFDARQGDAYVRRAFYPEGAVWLLRFSVEEPDEDKQFPGIWGDFDLTGPSDLCERALRALVQGPFAVEDAKLYFDSAYGG